MDRVFYSEHCARFLVCSLSMTTHGASLVALNVQKTVGFP